VSLLKIIDRIPDGLLEAKPSQLAELLGGPTLIHLQGRREPALFVSLMLHGNEPTGLLAMQVLLKNYIDQELPRALSVFIGNVSAASLGMRRLDGQPDYNRIWSGVVETPEHEVMTQVIAEMRQRGVFASVDIHNNTGLNPHYACINKLEVPFLQLAAMFSRTVVYFVKPEGVQSKAFAELCPAVTLECGQPGQKYGVDHAKDFVDACLNLAEIPIHPVPAHDVTVFHTVAVVNIPEAVSFTFGDGEAQLQFFEDVDHFNFSELPVGTVFGRTCSTDVRLLCQGEHGEDLSDKYFSYQGGKIQLAAPVMPSMLTLNEKVIRQDCFCYLMERLDIKSLGDDYALGEVS
jgi:succinylglutamate desuccinylase